MDATNHQFFDRSGKPCMKPTDRAVIPRRSCYGIAIRDGTVLMVRPTWTNEFELPGGGMEAGETTEQTLTREFLEETSCTVKMLSFLAEERQQFYADDTDTYYDSLRQFFLVAIEQERPRAADTEIAEVKWLPMSTLHEHANERNQRMVRAALERC